MSTFNQVDLTFGQNLFSRKRKVVTHTQALKLFQPFVVSAGVPQGSMSSLLHFSNSILQPI